ncbi:MAG: YbjN domain-containing protein [Chloroflexota bacterium]|nr:YbjN domain-containing protein [Chloroflexota bacterium]
MEGWLAELGLTPLGRADREGATSWDLLLDGRRRRRVRMTVILEPRLGLVAWVHYAPPLSDNFRKTYRQLLRWNDELPFAKFAISEDERPVLTAELASSEVGRESVGLLLARLLAICDLLYAQSAAWVDRIRTPGRRADAPAAGPDPAGVRLLERHRVELGELGDAGTVE